MSLAAENLALKEIVVALIKVMLDQKILNDSNAQDVLSQAKDMKNPGRARSATVEAARAIVEELTIHLIHERE